MVLMLGGNKKVSTGKLEGGPICALYMTIFLHPHVTPNWRGYRLRVSYRDWSTLTYQYGLPLN